MSCERSEVNTHKRLIYSSRNQFQGLFLLLVPRPPLPPDPVHHLVDRLELGLLGGCVQEVLGQLDCAAQINEDKEINYII